MTTPFLTTPVLFSGALDADGTSETAPELLDQGQGFRGGNACDAEANFRGRHCGEIGKLRRRSNDGDALIRAIGAGAQIGDGQVCGGSGEDGPRRRHAVEEPENFELGLKLVGHAVNGQIGLAHGVFNGGDEADSPGVLCERSGGEFVPHGFARVFEVGGQDIFKRDAKAGAGGPPGKPAPERTGSDDGYGEWQAKAYLALRADMTSSALGCDCNR